MKLYVFEDAKYENHFSFSIRSRTNDHLIIIIFSFRDIRPTSQIELNLFFQFELFIIVFDFPCIKIVL